MIRFGREGPPYVEQAPQLFVVRRLAHEDGAEDNRGSALQTPIAIRRKYAISTPSL